MIRTAGPCGKAGLFPEFVERGAAFRKAGGPLAFPLPSCRSWAHLMVDEIIEGQGLIPLEFYRQIVPVMPIVASI
jgi:hypothetical protein